MAALEGANKGLRILLGIARRRRSLILFACLLSAVSTVLSFGPALAVFGIARELAFASWEASALWFWGAIALAFLVARLLFLGSAIACSHIAAYGALYDLRMALAEKLSRVPLGVLTARTSGSLRKILQDDVERIEVFIAHMLPDAAAALTAPITGVAVLFWIDWRLGLAGLATLPIAFLLQALMYRDVDEMMALYTESQEKINGTLVEFLNGISIIKAFNLTAHSFERLRASLQAYRDLLSTYSRQVIPAWSAFTVAARGNILFLAPVGLWLAMSERITGAELVFGLLVGLGLTAPLLRLIMASGNLRMIEQGSRRISEIMTTPDLPMGNTQIPKNNTVSFEDVSFSYDEGETLTDISFAVPEGTRTALVGPSGAGKTTLALLLGRFWDVTAGAVKIGTADVRNMTQEEINARIALVFQDIFLFDGTVAENIRMGNRDASAADVMAAARAARADHFIQRLPKGYDTQIGERGARLSGGERQRLSIARAMLKDAPIVVLDEATAFADPMNEALINEALAQLTRGKTLIVIAHRLSAVAGFDQIVVLDRGQLAARGRHDEILASSPLYAKLWRAHRAARGWRFRSALDPEAAE